MAGIAAFHFQFNPSPILSPSAARLKQPNPPPTSSLPLSFSNGSSARGGRCLRVNLVAAAAARYGGGGGPRRFPSDARADPDYDPALDLGRVQSASVRLLDEQQNMIGIVSKDKAIQMAEDADLTLAVLSADADPPVLRLFDSMDYKKYKYEQQKRKRVQLKRSAASRMDIKELKMGYNIDSHDYAVRLKAAQKFLKDGDKVKVIVNLKGRENEFRNIAVELIKRFQSDIGELATEESKNLRERNIFMVLTPNKAVVQKAQEQPKKKETPATEVSANV